MYLRFRVGPPDTQEHHHPIAADAALFALRPDRARGRLRPGPSRWDVGPGYLQAIWRGGARKWARPYTRTQTTRKIGGCRDEHAHEHSPAQTDSYIHSRTHTRTYTHGHMRTQRALLASIGPAAVFRPTMSVCRLCFSSERPPPHLRFRTRLRPWCPFTGRSFVWRRVRTSRRSGRKPRKPAFAKSYRRRSGSRAGGAKTPRM